MKRLNTLVLAFLVNLSSAMAKPEYPAPGYNIHPIPLLFEEIGKKGEIPKGFNTKWSRDAKAELKRDTAYAIELPPPPSSGPLFVELLLHGKPDPDASEYPIIQVYGALFTFDYLETPDGAQYSFFAVTNNSDTEELWSAPIMHTSRARLTHPRRELTEEEKDEQIQRVRSGQAISLAIDFDSQTWRFSYPRGSESYPLLQAKKGHFAILHKNSDDESYLSVFRFRELERRDNSTTLKVQASEGTESQLKRIASEIRNRREERQKDASSAAD